LIKIAFSVVLREWRVQRRYPISMINLALLTPLYQLALPTLLLGSAFVVGGSATGLAHQTGTTDLAGWIGLGVLAATLLVGAVSSVYNTLEADRLTGVIEHSWASPAPRESYVIGAVFTGTIFAGVSSAILLAFASLVLGARFDLLGVAASVPALALMVLANCGYSYFVGAAVLALRRAEALVDVLTMMAVLFAGATFPLTLLPEPVRWVTYALPETLSLDVIRHLTLGTQPLLPVPIELAVATVIGLAWFALGRRTFLAAERGVRTTGSLAQY
jgi:ABC-type polysaccharide/polyol phosphate export permease